MLTVRGCFGRQEQLPAARLRGSYLPVRGGLSGDKPTTEADVKQLRGRIDALAKEETAIAAAIRESHFPQQHRVFEPHAQLVQHVGSQN